MPTCELYIAVGLQKQEDTNVLIKLHDFDDVAQQILMPVLIGMHATDACQRKS